MLPRISTGSDSVTSPAGIAFLVLIEVQVTFDSEVKAELFMNRRGTIVGPEEVKN